MLLLDPHDIELGVERCDDKIMNCKEYDKKALAKEENIFQMRSEDYTYSEKLGGGERPPSAQAICARKLQEFG